MTSARASKLSPSGGSLGRRIFLWMLALTVLPIAAVAWQGYHCARQAVVDSVRADLGKVATARRSRLETWISERENDLTFLASNPCTFHDCCAMVRGEDGAHTRMCNVLEQVRGQVAAYEGISVYNSEWQAGACAGEARDGAQLRSALAARLEESSGPAIGPVAQRAGGHQGFDMGLRLSGREERGEAFLVASIDLRDTLDPILHDLEGLGASGKAYVVDERGVVIASSVEADEGRAVESEGIRRALGGASGADEYADHRGAEVVGGFAAIPRLGWAVIVERDRAEALHWIGILAWRAVIVVLVAALAVALFSRHVSQRLSHPIGELAAVSNRIRSGELAARVPELRGEEARAVGRALNQTLDELATAQERLVNAATLAAIGELSSSVVHEMRNPLSAIKLNLQALEAHVSGDATHGELAAIACKQVARIERMLGDLLDFSKPLELELADVDLASVVSEAARAVELEARAKGISLSVGPSDGPLRARIDRERIDQALANLLRNALQALPPGGSATLSAGRVDGSSPQIFVEVCDDGPGLASDNMDRLFKPFFSTRDEGTGLGLANVKKIVDLHGGRVQASQAEAGGACFRIELPA